MSENNWFMKTPCIHCPYRHNVKPFLNTERGDQLANHAANPYNSFPCHKTTVSDEEFGGDGEENVRTEQSLECAGFLTLQINEGRRIPDGFTPAYELVYADSWEMSEAYAIAYDERKK